MRKFKRLTLTLALLLTAVGAAWAQDTYNVTFKANGNTTTVENVTLPHTFKCDIWTQEGELDHIIKELYGLSKGCCRNEAPTSSGSENVTGGLEDDSQFITISAPFEGTATVNGIYEGENYIGFNYSLEITCAVHEPTEWSLTPDETGKTWTLAKMPASDVELQVEYEPTKVTMAANDNAMGTVEVASGSKVEWTADTWKGWNYDTKEYTVGDITMTSSKKAYIRETTEEGDYKNSLSIGVLYVTDQSTVTFSTTGDPFSRIEFTMLDDYDEDNPHILPLDNWTFEGKSAVWEGEATKSLTLQSCTTDVSKITFYQGDGAIPEGVTVNGDGTFTVAKTATVTLKATPAEGYKFLYWEDDQSNTNPVREVTIESGMADKTYKAVFAEILYNVTFVEGTNLDEWSATPDTDVKKDAKVDIKYTGEKKVIGVKVEKKAAAPALKTLANATAEDLGKIAGADGNIYDTKAAAEAAGTTAVAMIAYVGSDTGNDTYTHGMALALSDEGEMNWSNAKSTCEGKSAVSGAAWLLPSRNQWKAMFKANGGNEGNYTGLNTAVATAGGDSSKLQKNERYWSSSEQGSNFAWVLVLGEDSAGWDGAPEDLGHHVRACLAF